MLMNFIIKHNFNVFIDCVSSVLKYLYNYILYKLS